MEVLLLPVEKDLYSIPVQLFREVIARPRVTRLPDAPLEVRGLINVRGEIVPLFDVRSLLGIGAGADASYAAVFDTAAGQAAIASTAPPYTEALGDRVGVATVAGTRGVYQQGELLATLLDLDRLLERLRQ